MKFIILALAGSLHVDAYESKNLTGLLLLRARCAGT